MNEQVRILKCLERLDAKKKKKNTDFSNNDKLGLE